MKRTPPDPETLDALITGSATEAEAEQGWAALIGVPGAADAWNAAVERRERLDAHGALIRGRPWLARSLTEIRRVARRLKTLPGITLEVSVEPLVLASLGPTDDSPSRRVEPQWGQTVTLGSTPGERIRFKATDAETTRVFWRTADNEGELESNESWKLEKGESPVLLVATSCTDPAGLDDALRRGVAAGVLLLEEESPPGLESA